MHVSRTGKSSGKLEPLSLLLTSILSGGDAILISEGGEGRVLLDSVATSLAGLRSRILRAAEVLPDSLRTPGPSLHMSRPLKANVPDDASLIQNYKALTVLDRTCDRIVLLVSDAHGLQPSALRYIQFVSRAGASLQLVFSGTRKFFDLLESDEFAWLRTRLTAGLVVTLATPVPGGPTPSPRTPIAPHMPAASAGRSAVPGPDWRRPKLMAGRSSRNLRIAAVVLSVVGGASWLRLCIQNGATTGSVVSRQAPFQPTPSERLALVTPQVQLHGSLTSRAIPAAPNAPVPHPPAMAGAVRSAGPASPSSMPLTPHNGGDLASIQLPVALHPTALKAPTRQVSDGSAAHDTASLARANTAPGQPALAGPAQGTHPMPSSAAGPREPATAPPPVRAGVRRSEWTASRRPKSVLAFDMRRHTIRAALSRIASIAPDASASHRHPFRTPATLLRADDQRLAPQPASGSGDESPRYIGSYVTGPNGVRMFHLDP